MKSIHRHLVIIAACLIFAACTQTTEIPFPKELSENPQPVAKPLELTDPKPLHWDTVSRKAITPKVFPLDFKKMKGMPYDARGFKPLPAPTELPLDFADLPSKPFDLDKIPSHELKFNMQPLPASFPSVKVNRPERVVASSLDMSIMQQVSGSKAAGPTYTMKDSLGMLWIGTTNGLYRFDGSHLENIIPAIAVSGMNMDKQGRIWIISSEQPVASMIMLDLKKGQVGKWKLPLYFPASIVMYRDSEGYFWGGSSRPPLSVIKINPEKGTYQIFDKKSGLANLRYYQIIEDDDKNLWLCSANGIDVMTHAGKKIVHLGKENGLSDDNITAITKSIDGRIWAGWPKGVDVIDLKNKKITHYQTSSLADRTFMLLFDKAGQLWQGRFSTGEIKIINLKDHSYRTLNEDDGFGPGVVAIDIYDDGQGRIYLNGLQSNLGGSTYLIGQQAKTVYPFGNEPIYSCVEDAREHLWIGTAKHLIAVDSARKSYWAITSSLGIANDTIEAIIPQNGKVIITTNGGYNIFDANKNELLRVSKTEGLVPKVIYWVMPDTEGNQWISATNEGLFKYDPVNELTLQLTDSGGLNGSYSIQTLQLKNRNIWSITNETPGIIDPVKNTIRIIKNIPELTGQVEKIMFVDSHDRIWLGITGQLTTGKLFMIDNKNKTYTEFSTKNGLSDNHILSVLEKDGKIIVSTRRMINIITPPELSSSKKWEIHLLKGSENLVKAENTYVSDAITKRGNFLWGDDGIHIIYGIRPDTAVAKCYVTGMNIMAQQVNFKEKKDTGLQSTVLAELRWDSLSGPYAMPENLKLPYNDNVLQFRFSEMSTGRTDTTTYAYILEGLDTKWTTTTDDHTQTYLNLTPGNYTLKVRSRWSSGRWSEPAMMSFAIRPPWYNTWWAYLIYIAGVVILLRLYMQFRSRKLKKENKLLEEKVKVRTEELQQSYNNVEQLGEIGRKITSSLSVENIIRVAYKNVNSLMDASVFGIGIYNPETQNLDFPATYENGEALPLYSNPLNDKNRLGSICFNSGKEIIISNLDEQYEDFIQKLPNPHSGQQAVSLIYLPLTINEKKIGVITVQSFKKNAYSDFHLYMLRNIANYTTIALENAESFTKLNQSLLHLKETQSQLVQSEKMASLGELTAGIAHEIQNPLNFVNNFSEVNKEILEELKAERLKPNEERDEDLQDDLINNVIENSEKINHHGKRADAIVKGMLQHSRKSSGEKELTDINALADEYLRLSYHGLRAKDKSFNATMETNFDPSVGKINIIPQEIGRMFLNLFNNAFYAVSEKQKLNESNHYKPMVFVKTEKCDDKIYIQVTDNGKGIPQKILDKIFQPFFTTKPTGQGTGLGLSLSYDIIKMHHGTVNVETKEGEGTTFIVQLPGSVL
jgi:signal transduction histidine kinase/ligand-binding sensor domain-containing protein